MASQFVVLIECPVDKSNDITLFLHGNYWKYWHWIEGSWLVYSDDDALTAKDLWVIINEEVDLFGHYGLIIKIGSDDCYYALPTASLAWLAKYWSLSQDKD